MKSYNSGRLIAEKLKMSSHTGQHVVLCPFHPNTETPSLSIDLDKGVFFCHSACDEPKGGGVVEFLVKWAKIVDQKPITKREAQRLLHRSFSVPNAKTLLREAAEEDLTIFAFFFPHYVAGMLREMDKEVPRVEARWSEYPAQQSWKRLAEVYHMRPLYEWAWDVFRRAQGKLNDEVAAVYRSFKQEWDTGLAAEARATARARAKRTRIARRLTPTRIVRTPVAPEKGDLCRESQSSPTRTLGPEPTQTTIPRRTPITTQATTRQPVQ